MNSKVVLVALMTLGIIVGVSTAATHIVGDRTGWTLPSSPSFYSDWASKHTFQLGDLLVFNFPSGAHTVGEVSKSGYDSCTTTATLTAVKTTAPSNYTITKGGSHYFLCTIPGHCTKGQKLAITVAATPSSPPTAGEPIPSAEGPTASGPSAGGATPPPPGTNAASSTVASAFLFSLMALTVVALF